MRIDATAARLDPDWSAPELERALVHEWTAASTPLDWREMPMRPVGERVSLSAEASSTERAHVVAEQGSPADPLASARSLVDGGLFQADAVRSLKTTVALRTLAEDAWPETAPARTTVPDGGPDHRDQWALHLPLEFGVPGVWKGPSGG